MYMATVFGLNQIISHGFGMFLFAALVPVMRESIAISHWHLATIGALTQLSYLGGAMLLSLYGHRIGTRRLVLITGSLTTSLLFTLSQLKDPALITAVLTLMAACASISWGAIIEIISRYAAPERRATVMSTAASGTAWGYGMNGLLILLIVPLLGWQSGWLLAGSIGVIMLLFTWPMLRKLTPASQPAVHADAPSATDEQSPIPGRRLLAAILGEHTARSTCLIYFLLGATTMPFANWLNTWLAELQLSASLGGYTWTTVGITGMAAGFLGGKLADRYGHVMAMLVICSGFALGLVAFNYSPEDFVLLAGVGYGLMYFPIWGITAGWLNQRWNAIATMQINSICMVAFGLGGTLANLLTGYIRDSSGSLELAFTLQSAIALLLVAILLHTWLRQPQPYAPAAA